MKCTNISCFLKFVILCSTLLLLQLLVYNPMRSAKVEGFLSTAAHATNQTSGFSFPKLIGNMSASECSYEYNVIVAISSSPENVLLRKAIRTTFGSVLPIKFFLGQCRDSTERKKRPRCDAKGLEKEAERQKDLVVYDFLDTYENLTLKTFSVLDFVTKCAPFVKLLIKIDDDTFVNPIRLRDILAEHRVLPSKDSTERRKPLIFGQLQRGAKPYRNRSSRYYISREEYSPNEFPPFVSGPFYFMNRLSVEALYRIALETSWLSRKKPLHLEDVFFTGFMAKAANVSLVHINGLDNGGLSKLPLPRHLISRHFVRDASKVLRCWRHLLGDVNRELIKLRQSFFQKHV